MVLVLLAQSALAHEPGAKAVTVEQFPAGQIPAQDGEPLGCAVVTTAQSDKEDKGSGHQQPSTASANAEIQYQIAFPDAASHYITVQLQVPVLAEEMLQLVMPTWTPGSYMIREHARHMDQLSARAGTGDPLVVEKSAKNRWVIRGTQGRTVLIQYRLYCREMSVRTNWVDHEFAVLNGAATFISLDGFRDIPHVVSLQLPGHWSRVVTALPAVDDQATSFRAGSWDQLIDSPLICGNPVVDQFSVGGRNHTLAHLGDAELWDTPRATADVRQIVASQQAFWGTVPYSNYAFLNVISEASGGLEHDNSALVMTSRWNFRDPEKYEDWLSLISHEFFHTWNVRRLRPAGLQRYDYESENLTRSLWIAEGITSYYEDLMLIRAGLIDQKAYLRRLSKSIEKLQTSPGRLQQSLAESSFDAWIKFYRPDENSANSRVSYYVKGCVVAFLLDAYIRQATQDERSLDDVMRRMYADYSSEAGFTDQQFAAVVSDVCGQDMTAWLAQHIETTEELDYQPALDWLGLQFAPQQSEMPAESESSPSGSPPPDLENTPTADNDSKASGDAFQKDGKPRPAWLGIKTEAKDGQTVILYVQDNSPASSAGLNVGDELLAFNGYRVHEDNWQKRLTQLGIERSVEILISRRGEVQTVSVVPQAEPSASWSLKLRTPQSDEQTVRRIRWLGDAAKPEGRISSPPASE